MMSISDLLEPGMCRVHLSLLVPRLAVDVATCSGKRIRVGVVNNANDIGGSIALRVNGSASEATELTWVLHRLPLSVVLHVSSIVPVAIIVLVHPLAPKIDRFVCTVNIE